MQSKLYLIFFIFMFIPYAGHPCSGRTGILPHPTQCHWYYNCSLNANQAEWEKHEPFTVECPYPQLFDEFQMRCREYLNVKCGSRFEPVAHCEYINVLLEF